ncbi:MAG: hypothetical protein K2N54_00685, partial [Helicobacter sp.]|nr:hypothetical protein [Helicobacter sp.]
MHKVALKKQDTLMIEHYASNEIPPAKTWIFHNENQITHLMQAYNGDVLLIDTLNKDNTRTILAKNKDTIIKTSMDASGNATTTHEEAGKNIELFSKFLQESEGIETAGGKELQSTFQALNTKEILEKISQFDLSKEANANAKQRLIVSNVDVQEQELLEKDFSFKGRKPLVREIDSHQIIHALNQHGDEATEANRGQIAIQLEDIANYQQITKNHDLREVQENGKIVYAKQVNGHYVVLEEVLEGQDKLRFFDMWKGKGQINKEVLLSHSQRPNTNPSQNLESRMPSNTADDSTPPNIKDGLEKGELSNDIAGLKE